MESKCKIAEAGLVGMLYEMNNPLTNLRLSIEQLELGNEEMKDVYFEIMKKSIETIELSVRHLTDSFMNEDYGVHINMEEFPSKSDEINPFSGMRLDAY